MQHYGEGEQRLAEDITMVLGAADADVQRYLARLPPLEKVTSVCPACGETLMVRPGHVAEDRAFAARICPGGNHAAPPG